MIDHDSFAGREHSDYRATPPGGGPDFVLQLTGCGALVRDGGYETFTLTFTSSTQTPQGTVLLTGEGLENEAVFVVPVGASDGVTEYEAVFSQPAPKSEER